VREILWSLDLVSLVEMKKHKKKWQICFGISQSYISRLEKKIIGKMKKDIMSKTG
jgi:DNA-directed RNA polymerase specialized sigma subunit